MTSRIESIAGAGDIMFSEAVYWAMNKNEIPFVYVGERVLKGVDQPVKIFRVKKRSDLAAENLKQQEEARKAFGRKLRRIIFKIFVLAFLFIVLYVAFWYLSNYSAFLG